MYGHEQSDSYSKHYPEPRPTRPVRAGQMAKHQKENPRGASTRNILARWFYPKSKMGHSPAARHQEPVNPQAGISPIGENRLSHDIKENTSVLMTFRVSYFDPEPPKTSRDSSSTNRSKLLSVYSTPTFLLQFSTLRLSKIASPFYPPMALNPGAPRLGPQIGPTC